MNTLFNNIRRHLPGILGLIAVLTYLSAVFGLLQIPRRLAIVFILAISPIAIYGVISIGETLKKGIENDLMVKVGTIFGIVAFSIWILVHTIQQGGRIYFREKLIAGASGEEMEQVYRQVYQAVNTTQATMDIGFDIFYCLLIIVFSYYMYQRKDFGKVVGILGIGGAAGMLVLNLWTFPYPPADVGLIDLGPVTGAWWLLVIFSMFRKESGRIQPPGDAP